MKKYIHILTFLILAFLTMPFFQKWYFFLLDNSFFPKIIISLNDFFNISYFFFILIFKVFSFIMPSWLIQRLFYIWTLFLLWFWWYKLLEKKTKVWAYFSWILMIFNPFVYSRILDGQIGIVAGIAMCLFFYHFLIKFLENRKTKDLLLSSLFWAFSIMWMSHSLFFVFWSLLAFLSFDYFKNKDLKFLIKSFLISFILILALNANWILWNILWNWRINQTIWQIWENHFEAFATDSWGINLYFNTLSLHWFWWEREWRYLPTYFENTNWKILFIVLFLVILIWIISQIKNKENKNKMIDYSFLMIWIIAFILALWISWKNIFSVLTQFLYSYVPFYKWLREPQKWVWILLIVYSYFWWLWAKKILEYKFVKSWYPKLITVWLLLIPILYTPTMLLWFNWQLFVTDYPREWYKLNEKFFKDKENNWKYDVLSLPWHQYIWFGFAGKIIANPSEWFFYNAKVLQADNMEIGKIYTQSTRPESKIIEKYIWPGWLFLTWITDSEANYFINDLKLLWIKQILLLKEVDYKKYDSWLNIIEKDWKIKTSEDNERLKFFTIN